MCVPSSLCPPHPSYHADITAEELFSSGCVMLLHLCAHHPCCPETGGWHVCAHFPCTCNEQVGCTWVHGRDAQLAAAVASGRVQLVVALAAASSWLDTGYEFLEAAMQRGAYLERGGEGRALLSPAALGPEATQHVVALLANAWCTRGEAWTGAEGQGSRQALETGFWGWLAHCCGAPAMVEG